MRIAPVVPAIAAALGLASCASRGPYVRMATTAGDMVVELDERAAPVTAANFLAYADKHEGGGYDGTVFHRVVAGFVIQGGGYSADMKEQPSGKPIRLEWPNGLLNVRGSIAMAREEAPGTATREFFINLVDNPKLDTAREKSGNAGYAVFGRVVAGMDVVDRIGAAKTGPRPDPKVTDGSLDNVPLEAIVIRRVERISAQEAAKATGR